MSGKIQKPFGRVAKRIVIEADDNGTIRVVAVNVPLVSVAGAPLLPMDSREMVLALMKVNLDYTSALFETLTLTEGKSDGQQERENKNPKQPN